MAKFHGWKFRKQNSFRLQIYQDMTYRHESWSNSNFWFWVNLPLKYKLFLLFVFTVEFIFLEEKVLKKLSLKNGCS